MLWPPDEKSRLIRKWVWPWEDWRREEKGETEDELVGWHHRLDGHESAQALGDCGGLGSLACFGSDFATEQPPRPTFSSSIHRRNWTLSGAVLSSPASVNTQGHVLHPLVVLTHRHWECHPYVPWPCTRPAGIRPTSAERSELNTHSAAEESSWDMPCWPESSPPELPGSRWPAVQSTFFSATTPALCPGIHRWLLDLHDSLLSGGPELTT